MSSTKCSLSLHVQGPIVEKEAEEVAPQKDGEKHLSLSKNLPLPQEAVAEAPHQEGGGKKLSLPVVHLETPAAGPVTPPPYMPPPLREQNEGGVVEAAHQEEGAGMTRWPSWLCLVSRLPGTSTHHATAPAQPPTVEDETVAAPKDDAEPLPLDHLETPDVSGPDISPPAVPPPLREQNEEGFWQVNKLEGREAEANAERVRACTLHL